MKKHFLLLFLFTTTLALAKENYIPFNNSEIILSTNGKELEIVFDIENLSTIVQLKKLNEKTNSNLDFNLSEEKLILSHEDYKKGSYILTIDDEVRTEEILLNVSDKAFKIIDRRLINKPIFQFSDNKFRVLVLENDIPIIVSIESLSGRIIHQKEYSSNDLKKKVFRLKEVDEKNIVTLKYKGKVFKKSIRYNLKGLF
jgi:hypothetical protein